MQIWACRAWLSPKVAYFWPFLCSTLLWFFPLLLLLLLSELSSPILCADNVKLGKKIARWPPFERELFTRLSVFSICNVSIFNFRYFLLQFF